MFNIPCSLKKQHWRVDTCTHTHNWNHLTRLSTSFTMRPTPSKILCKAHSHMKAGVVTILFFLSVWHSWRNVKAPNLERNCFLIKYQKKRRKETGSLTTLLSLYVTDVCEQDGNADDYCWSLLYISLFSTLKQTHCNSEQVIVPLMFLISTVCSGVLTTLHHCYMAGATRSCCHLGTCSVYTIQPCTSLQCYFIPSRIHRVHVFLSVTCYLHFWQNKRDILHPTAVLQSYGYWNESQHRRLTPEKKILLPKWV